MAEPLGGGGATPWGTRENVTQALERTKYFSETFNILNRKTHLLLPDQLVVKEAVSRRQPIA